MTNILARMLAELEREHGPKVLQQSNGMDLPSVAEARQMLAPLNAAALAATTAAISCGFFDIRQTKDTTGMDTPEIPYERIEGGIGLFALLASYAEDIERLWMRHDTEADGAPGVWDYEVSEPFGTWLRMNSLPDRDDALAELARLDAAFWAQ